MNTYGVPGLIHVVPVTLVGHRVGIGRHPRKLRQCVPVRDVRSWNVHLLPLNGLAFAEAQRPQPSMLEDIEVSRTPDGGRSGTKHKRRGRRRRSAPECSRSYAYLRIVCEITRERMVRGESVFLGSGGESDLRAFQPKRSGDGVADRY